MRDARERGDGVTGAEIERAGPGRPLPREIAAGSTHKTRGGCFGPAANVPGVRRDDEAIGAALLTGVVLHPWETADAERVPTHFGTHTAIASETSVKIDECHDWPSRSSSVLSTDGQNDDTGAPMAAGCD